MTSPVLLLTVGLPRAGKSTWAKSTGYPVVNPDSIRLAMHGQAFFGPAEPLVWAIAHLMVQSLFKAGHAVVVLDATSVSRHRRSEWRSKEWTCGYVCFKTDKAECIARALRNGQHELVPVIERMDRHLEWPEDEEGAQLVAETMNGHRFLHYVEVGE